MAQRIQAAIERGALELRYHPRVEHDLRVAAVDVEVVWDVQQGFDDAQYDVDADPSAFLAMTRWAIVRAGLELGPLGIPRMGFKLSSSVMSEPALAEVLAAAAQEATLPAPHVELLVSRPNSDAIQRLSGAGFSLTAEVGADGPSLKDLVKHPFSAIWMHRDLIKGLDTDFRYAVLVRSLIQLGHGLDLRVVASGVDEQRAWAYLRELECDEVQGRVLGPAMDAAQLRAALTLHTGGVRVLLYH